MCRPIWCCRQEGEHGESGARPDSGLVSDSSSVNDVLSDFLIDCDIYHDDPWWSIMHVFFCKCILIIHLVIARHADQTYGTEFRVWVVLPSFQVNRQPCLHLGKLQVQCFLQGHWTVVDWGELINQWLEQIWWVYLPHMLVAKSFPNPLIDWCWCGSHVVPRSQMIGTPQGLSKSCLSTGCTWHSTCHSAQVFQDRPCHEHTGSWTNHQVLRHVGWLLQGESFELIKKTNSL
jgi:hypothetical protein